MSNNILLVDGTPITFKESGGTVLWTPKNVANGAGRISTQADLGATRYRKWRWSFLSKFQTATVGNIIRLYLVRASTGAITYQDGNPGITDAALSTEALLANSGKLIGPLVVHHTTAANCWSGEIEILARFVSIAIWNAAGVALTNTAGDHEFRLEPVNDQVQ